MTGSRVLVLSAHDGQLDRRIGAEINTLAAGGRRVTLVSVSAEMLDGCLDSSVRVIAPSAVHPVADRWRTLKSLVRRLGPGVYERARGVLYASGRGPAAALTRYFLQAAPDEPFDVIHCHDLNTLPAAVVLGERGGARIVYDSHELFPCQYVDRRVERYWAQIEEAFIRRADRVITVNQSIANELADRYGIPRPVVIYNSYGLPHPAVDVSREEFLRHFGAADGPACRVLYQGNLDYERNLELLLDAFDSPGGDAQLFLLGDGPLAGRLRKLAARRRTGNVFVGGPVPQSRLLAYTRHADLGVIPYPPGRTLNTLYCTPNKLFEYIEAGVPVCASDLPELRRIVEGGRIGAVYHMETTGQIAAALRDCTARCRRGEFSGENIEAARMEYRWERQADKLLALYAELGV